MSFAVRLIIARQHECRSINGIDWRALNGRVNRDWLDGSRGSSHLELTNILGEQPTHTIPSPHNRQSLPFDRIFRICFLWFVQFHRLSRNWCSHSLKPNVMPRATYLAIDACVLQSFWTFPPFRLSFLHSKWMSSNKWLPLVLQLKN